MKTTRLLLIAALVASVLPATAGEGEDRLPPGMTPEMMEAWQKVSSPNEHHQHLARMAGTWDVQGTFWMQPGAPPMETKGVSHNEMIFDGRFLQTRYDSEFMGEPFHGIGFDGYDNALGQHVGMWVDSAGTAMYRFEGECSDGGKVLTNLSESLDPMSGELKKMKSVLTLVDENEYTFESWNEGPDGTFYKSMVLTYTRRKS